VRASGAVDSPLMPGPRHLAPATRRRGRDRLVVGVGALLCLLLLGSAAVVGYLNHRFGQLQRFDVAIDVPPASGEPRNYLIVGSDSRAGLNDSDPANAMFFDDEGTVTSESSQRTDTIMVLRLDPDSGDAALLSLPRDLWVPIADDGDHNRINVAYTRGREVLIDTIRENFGIPIHHYVEIDFRGFLGLVDAVGGVPFYFDTPVRDTESGLSVPASGCTNLGPRQALSFARARHLEYMDQETGEWETDPSGDLGRITRQQEFIRRAISEAVSKGMTNPAKMNELLDVAVDHVGLDPTLSVRDLLSLGRRFASFDADSLKTYSLPGTPMRTAAGASVLELEEREAERMLNIFRGLDPDSVSPGLVEVTVMNATGADGFAGDITDAFDQIGFATGEPGTVENSTRTTLHYAPGSEEEAALVARHLTTEPAFVADDELDASEVSIVAGADFTTVHEQPSPTVPELPPATSPPTAQEETSTTTATTTTTTEPVGFVPGEDRDPASCA
jgi:polyisoprenyl-teichoic acid--peptidoglycan teichoic acid transferase